MELEIRAPGEADLDSLFDCLRTYGFHLLGGAGPVVDPEFDDDAVLAVRNRVAQVDLADKCFVAVNVGEVAGFCCWAWLDEARGIAKTVLICVRPERRERGVGARLQQRRMDDMRARGARELHTWTVDPRSVAWYGRHFGYRVLGAEPVRHSLHRWTLGERVFWGIHRGFRGHDELTHMVTELEPGDG
jgi:N-acetylglutamate synthase-like GNAT family acetyltransferase